MIRLSAGTVATLGLLGTLLIVAIAGGPWSPVPAWFAGALAATLTHEAGHAVGAALVGVTVDELRATPFGGAVRYAGEPDAAQRAAVSIAGPAASAVGALAVLLPPLDGDLGALVVGFWSASVVVLVVNLIPVGGTDGAHLLRALTERCGEETADEGVGREA